MYLLEVFTISVDIYAFTIDYHGKFDENDYNYIERNCLLLDPTNNDPSDVWFYHSFSRHNSQLKYFPQQIYVYKFLNGYTIFLVQKGAIF